MSFILEALRKAESERNRRVAPVLMDARVAPPRRGWPAWAWALGAVFLANLLVLAWLLWRTPATDAIAPVQGAASDGAATSPTGAPGNASPVGVVTGTASGGSAAAATSVDPIASAPAQAPASSPGGSPARAPTPSGPFTDSAPAATAPASTSAGTAGSARISSDSAASLPTLAELRAAGISLPDLQLDLHVYDPAPAHRVVLINAMRMREGEYTPNGVRVERITPSGVVLEASGRRFRLEAGGG